MAKLAVSATLVFVFLRGLDLDAAAAALSRIAYAPLIAALVVLAAIIALLGARWHLILQALGIALSPARTLAMTYIGAFFNQVLPTSMGGDVVRVWHTTRAGFGWKRAAASAVLERLAGAAGLVPLGGLGLWLL